MTSQFDRKRFLVKMAFALGNVLKRVFVQFDGIDPMTPSSAESDTPSLLARIARRLNSAAVLDLLGSESNAVRHVATEWLLTRLPADETERILLRGLDRDARVCLGVLYALRHPDIEVTEQFHRRVLKLLKSSDGAVRQDVLGLIVRRWPEDGFEILSDTEFRWDDESLRTLCLTGDPKLIPLLLKAHAFPQRTPPPTIGFLVTATWLAEAAVNHPQAVEWLSRECGYCEGAVKPDVIDLLSLGFSFVAEPMSPSGPADQWLERVRNLSWRLLPDADDATYRDARPFDMHDPLEALLFLNAVRETDRLQFAAQKMCAPSRSACVQGDPTPVCFHANARFVRRLFLADGRAMGSELRVPEEQMSEFVFDHARVALEVDPVQRTVADRRLRTEWQIRLATDYPGGRGSRRAATPEESPPRNAAIEDHTNWADARGTGGLTPPRSEAMKPHVVRKTGRPAPRTARQEPRASKPRIEPRRLVIGEFEPSTFQFPLSPGAQSVCQLAELAGLDCAKLANWLSERELR